MAGGSENTWMGRIVINGFEGYASFRKQLKFSKMSKRLAVGLETQEEIDDDGNRYHLVKPYVRLGDYGFEIQFDVRIYENEVPNLSRRGQFPDFPEVILGCDFIERVHLHLGTCTPEKICAPNCGHICRNWEGKKFERKSFKSTDYAWDVDGRVILLFDMDCFEVQVHEKPDQRRKPRVVVNSSDRILAVSYEAKQLGISRSTTPYLRQAIAKCKDLIAIYVPVRQQGTNQSHPRPDTSIAREATNRIVSAIKSCIPENATFQFSSGDEFYVDITWYVIMIQQETDNHLANHIQMDKLWRNTFLYNQSVNGQPTWEYVRRRLTHLKKKNMQTIADQEVRLIYGSYVASKVVKEILTKTTFQSSVGIGSKKLIAKIASGMHKPGSITILTPGGYFKFPHFVKIENIPGLGGKYGEIVKNHFQVKTMADLQNITFENLQSIVGEKKATEFLNSAFGIDDESVEPTDGFKTCSTTRKLYGKT